MNLSMVRRFLALTALLFFSATLLMGADDEKPNQKGKKQTEESSLEDLLKSPEKYEGKRLVFKNVTISGDAQKRERLGVVLLEVKSDTGMKIGTVVKDQNLVIGVPSDEAKELLKEIKRGNTYKATLSCTIVKTLNGKKWLAKVTAIDLAADKPDESQKGKKGSSKAQDGERGLKDEAKADDKAVQIVEAEGKGTTADEALKDAFRNAVRQVVGAVVDATTLVKNDEIISDKVLTYSDGFIKKYDEISNKHKDGIFEIKIKATVERRSVIAKLKQAKVTVKDVDGKSLFGEALTKGEASKNAKALLESAFSDFPLNCFEATATSKPELLKQDDSKITFEIGIVVEVNQKSYEAFTSKLQKTLKSISQSSGEFSLKASTKGEALSAAFRWDSTLPSSTFPKNTFAVVVNDSRTKSNENSEWKWYCVDESAKRLVHDLAHKKYEIKVSFVDKDGKSIAVERIPLSAKFGGFHSTGCGVFSTQLDLPEQSEFAFLVSPFFFDLQWGRGQGYLAYTPSLTFKPQMTLAAEEVKSIEKAKCEIVQKADSKQEGTKRRSQSQK